jgi:hypothetical protein
MWFFGTFLSSTAKINYFLNSRQKTFFAFFSSINYKRMGVPLRVGTFRASLRSVLRTLRPSMRLTQKNEKRKVKSEKWKVKSGKWKTKNEKWKVESGKWKMESEKWKMKSEKWKMCNVCTHFILPQKLYRRCTQRLPPIGRPLWVPLRHLIFHFLLILR